MIKKTEVTSLPYGIQTPHVAPWLQYPTWRSNAPRDDMFTTCKKQKQKKDLNIQHQVHLKKVSEDEVFISKLIRSDLLFCIAIAL